MGRGVRNQKKGMPSVEISELLSNAIDVNSGQWYQRELEQIRYRNGLDSGILTPLVKQQPEEEEDCGDKSPDFKPPRGVGRPPGRRGRKPKVRLADIDTKPARKREPEVLDKNDPDYEARMKIPGMRSKDKAVCNKCGKSFFGETVKKHEEKCQVQRLLKYRKEGITFFCAYADCPNPETGYKSKEVLLEHFDNFHFTDEDRTIPCTYETCAEKFATISQRNGHIRKNHDKQFSCTQCDKQFWVEKSLVDHVEKVHNRLPGDEVKVKETALCR